MYHISFKQFEGILLHRNKKHTDVWVNREDFVIKLIFHLLRTLIFISPELVSKAYIKYMAYGRHKFLCVCLRVFSPEVQLASFCSF